MISFVGNPRPNITGSSNYLVFDEEGMKKMVVVLNRALNTYHDKELTELLDQIKSYQEKS